MPFLGIGNYAKPGPGVRKDEEEKSVWVKFFVIFKRRLSKFMQLNLIFLLPLCGVLALMAGVFILPVMRWNLSMGLYTLDLWNLYVTPMPLLLLSPFWGGVMVVAKRLAREEYAFIWSEYWKGVKDNWKQFLLNGIFVYAVYVLLSFAFFYYSSNLTEGFFYYIPYGFVILVALIFLFAQYYVSVMIVSVNLGLKHIYKNALIFAIMGLGRNLLFTLILGVIVAAYLFIVNPIMLIICFALAAMIIFAFLAYTNSYLSYPIIQRYIIDPYENKGALVKNVAEAQTSTDDFSYLRDELDETNGEKSAAYVYVNGKLVQRDPDSGEEEQIFTDRT